MSAAPAPLVIAFDTSAAHCGGAVLCGSEVLAEAHEEMGRGQAERLFPMLEALLGEAGVVWRDLDGIGVGTGPGNFTGVRISVAAARGLALALEVPAVGVTMFEALALGAPRPALVCLSAPRRQLALQLFGPDGAVSEPFLATLEELPARLTEQGAGGALTCTGPEAGSVAAALGARAARTRHDPAVAIGRIALSRLDGPRERPRPLYLRPADAAPPKEAPPAILP
ncbi:MAG: tRNA (adenosine(37)-N6)-threonylcarbamoyltransferase complex dimerization subunit type 1 TsaB [Alphaproteobacteria bacterium]|nr:MAG: tRNA (adenosine(37)-N6)-threonylcarbamoyltransferase complex dimerization subunit type 1 TsaB [Alphaproteobacteria bacterium]